MRHNGERQWKNREKATTLETSPKQKQKHLKLPIFVKTSPKWQQWCCQVVGLCTSSSSLTHSPFITSPKNKDTVINTSVSQFNVTHLKHSTGDKKVTHLGIMSAARELFLTKHACLILEQSSSSSIHSRQLKSAC